MKFDEFVQSLLDAGWRDTADAQHENIKAVWPLLEGPISREKSIRQDYQLEMLRKLCAKAKAEGWRHIPIDTVVAFTHEVETYEAEL